MTSWCWQRTVLRRPWSSWVQDCAVTASPAVWKVTADMAIPVILFSLEMVLASWKSITHCLSHVFSTLKLLSWQPFILPSLLHWLPPSHNTSPGGSSGSPARPPKVHVYCRGGPPLTTPTQEEGAAGGAGSLRPRWSSFLHIKERIHHKAQVPQKKMTEPRFESKYSHLSDGAFAH